MATVSVRFYIRCFEISDSDAGQDVTHLLPFRLDTIHCFLPRNRMRNKDSSILCLHAEALSLDGHKIKEKVSKVFVLVMQ